MVLWKQNKYLISFLAVAFCLVSWFLFHEELESLWIILGSIVVIVSITLFVSKLNRILLFVFLFTPLSLDILISGGFKISAPTEITIVLLAFLFIIKWLSGLSIHSTILKHPISILLILDLAWSFVSLVFSEYQDVVFKRILLKVLFIGVFYFVSTQLLVKISDQKRLFWLYGIGMIIPIMNAFYKHHLLDFLQSSSVYVCQPFYNDHTIYAACLAFIIPFFILQIFNSTQKRFRILSILLSALFLTAFILSYSRAAWISIAIAFVFYIATLFKVRFWQLILLVAIIAGYLIVNFNPIYDQLRQNEVKYDDNVSTHITSVTNLQNDASNLERINRWVCAYRMFLDRPIMGHGSGTYQFVYDQYQTPEFMTRISSHQGNKGNAHSEYLTYLSENGIIGFILFTALVLYSVYLGIQLLYKIKEPEHKMLVYSILLGLITFYTHGLFNTFSDYDKMAVLYWGSLAILVRMDLRYGKASS